MRLAEDSDDEGFDISFGGPDAERLKAMKDVADMQNHYQPVQKPEFKGESPHKDPVVNSHRPLGVAQTVEYVGPSELPSNQPERQCRDGLRVSLQEIVSQFDDLPQPYPSIPLDSDLPKEFPAIVSAYRDATHFSVIVASVETKQMLEKLQSYGESCDPTFVNVSKLARGFKCGYKDQSKLFYRLELVKLLGDKTALLSPYDFGDVIKLPTSALFHLPEDIVSIPCLRRVCSLNKARVNSRVRGGSQFLRSLVAQKPVLIKNFEVCNIKFGIQILCCQLVCYDRSVDVIRELSVRQYCTYTPYEYRFTPNAKLFHSQQVTNPENKSSDSYNLVHLSNKVDFPSQQVTKPENKSSDSYNLVHLSNKVDFPSQQVTNPENKSSDSYNLVHLSNKVGFHSPPYNQTITILPKAIVSPSKIWAQVMHPSFSNFHRMQTDINAQYQAGCSTSYAPTVGEMCIAKFTQDRCYYRAEVLCVNLNGTVDIRFVDLGNRDTVTTGQLHYLKPIFLSLPKQGLLFSLAGVIPRNSAQIWDEAALAFLKDKILNRRVQVNIVSGTPSALFIELYDPENPSVTINDVLVQQGTAQAVHGSTGRPPSTPTTPTGSLVGVSVSDRNSRPPSSLSTPTGNVGGWIPAPLPTHGNPDSSKPFKTSVLKSPNSNLSAASPLSSFGQVRSPLGVEDRRLPFSGRNSSPTSSVVPQNTPQPSPNKWTPLSDNSQPPALVDSEGDNVNELSGLLTPPSTSDSSSSPLSPSYQRDYNDETSEVKSSSVPTPAKVTTSSPSAGEDPANIRQRRSTPKSPTSSFNDPSNSQKEVRKTICSPPRHIRNIELPENEKCIKVLVTHVTDPLSFWVQQVSDSSVATFKALVERLSQAELVQLPAPTAGDLCLCRFVEGSDTEICRARLNTIENGNVIVTYIDYGNSGRIPVSEVYEIRKSLVQLQQQAILCTLNQLRNPKGRLCDWSRDAADFFKSNVLDKAIEMKVVKCMGLKHVVDVFVETENGRQNLLQLMIGKGYGVSLHSSNDGRSTPGRRSTPDKSTENRSKNRQGALLKTPTSPIKEIHKSPSPLKHHHEAKGAEQSPSQSAVPRSKSVASNDSVEVRQPLTTEHELPRVKDMKTFSCPKDSSFQVVVSEVNSPHCLVVQPATDENAENLEKLSIGLNTHFQSQTPPTLPSTLRVGSLCCAKFSQDQLWYRAEVLKCSESECELYFIDYGNNDTAKLSDMTQCPSQFANVPVCAIKCAIAGVSPPRPDQEWPQKSTSEIMRLSDDKILQAKILSTRSTDDLPHVQLVDTSNGGSVDLSSKLIKDGFALTACSNVNVPRVSDMKKIALPQSSEVLTVLISEVCSPLELFVQLATSETADNLDKLATGLNSIFQSTPPTPLSAAPSKGSLCCAKFSDQCWYRAEVLETTESGCEVLFIDYGNKDTVDLKNMTACPEEFVNIPCCATKCGLAGIASPNTDKGTWPSETTAYLKEMTSEKILQAKVVVSGEIPLIKLRDSASIGTGGLGSELVKQGYACSSSSFSPKNNQTNVLPRVEELKKLIFPTETFDVLISEVCSPLELFVQLATSETADNLDKLATGLNSIFQTTPTTPLTAAPSKGSLCCAKFSDQSWYRAEVLETTESGCEVLFIDYGNKDTVDLKNMTTCPEEFVNIPCCATKCGLAGIVSPNSDKGTWPSETTAYLKKMTSEKILQAKVVVSGEIPLIKLRDPASIGTGGLGSELVKQGYACSSSSFSPKNNQTEVLESHPRVEELKKLMFPTETFDVLISEVCSPLELFVQLATSETADNLDKLSTGLNSIFQTTPPTPLTAAPSKGSLCCAKFSDQCWYRAEVLETTESGCEVLFVDYGNKDTVDLKNMTACPEEFVNIPCCATKCGLAGIVSPNSDKGTWPSEVIALLKQLSSDHIFQARVVGVDSNGLCLVDIWDNTVNFKDELLKAGHTTSSTTVPSLPQVSDMKKCDLPTSSDPFKIYISEVNNPLDFFVQLATQQVAMCINALSTDLTTFFETNPSQPLQNSPNKGSVCCAKFSQDGLYYRVEVLESSKSQCDVLFIDYGNRETVQLYDMVPCPSQFLSVPVCAVKCALDRVESLNADHDTWPKPACDVLKGLVNDNSILDAKFSGKFNSNNIALVDFVLPNGENVVDVFIKNGWAKSPVTGTESTLITKQLPVTNLPFARELKRPIIPTSADGFDVLVSEVFDPDKIFVQLATQQTAEALDRLSTGLASFFQKVPPTSLLQPATRGSLCCAKYAVDGAWYRVEVIDFIQSSLKIRFLDYGNEEVVPLNNLVECPEEFLSIPVCATHCCLDGVQPRSVIPRSWSIEVTAYIKRITQDNVLKARCVEAKLGVPVIQLCEENGISLEAEIIKKGFALPLKPMSGKSQSAGAVALPSTITVPDSVLPTGVRLSVKVVDVVDPSLFCVHINDKNLLVQLNELMNEMQAAYSNLSKFSDFSPILGAFCCTKFADDQCFYRCKIIRLEKNSALVRFIDFGNTALVSADTIYSLDRSFATQPSYGVLCSLDNIKSVSQAGWPAKSVQLFKDLFIDEQDTALTALVSEPISQEEVVSIKLYFDEGCTREVSDYLVKNECAVYATQTHQPSGVPLENGVLTDENGQSVSCGVLQSLGNGENSSAKIKPTVHSIPYVILPDAASFSVLITHINSVTDFYIQIATQESLEMQMKLMDDVHKYSVKAKPLAVPPAVGEFCIAEYGGDSWFRAQVIERVDAEVSEVIFIDFGNKERVSFSQMKPLPDEFLSVPIQAIPCGLYGVPFNEALKPTKSTEVFKSLVSMDSVSICLVVSQDPLLVDFEGNQGLPSLSIRDQLVRKNIFPQVSDIGMTCLQVRPLPSKESSVVILTDISSVRDFWLQVADLSMLADIEKLTQKLQDYCMCAVENEESPVLGQLVCAKFSQDGVWYRARVVEVLSLSSFKVRFIDFGNSEGTDVTRIRPFTPEFMHIPAQAVHCCLSGFAGSYGNSDASFRSMVEDRQMIAFNRGMSELHITQVELVDTSGTEDIYIHQVL